MIGGIPHMDKQYPAVSCFCSTYGRVHTLEELIESFLRQNYKGKKELVIFNDCELQKLEFDHPEVMIFNVEERIKPLGKKFNWNIRLCKYDVLCCMEDDDIYLPNHITYAVEHMNNGVFHTGNAWVEESEGKFHYAGNYFHATHVFNRELFDKVNGYPEIDNCTVDVGIMGRFREAIGNYSQPTNPEDLTYIYRWATANCYHASGWGSNINNVSELAKDVVTTQATNGDIPVGIVKLNPNWKYDYSAYLPRSIK